MKLDFPQDYFIQMCRRARRLRGRRLHAARMRLRYQTLLIMRYFSLTGSYEGGMKLRGRWVHVTELNRVDKTGWTRIMTGDMTHAMKACLSAKPITATDALKLERASGAEKPRGLRSPHFDKFKPVAELRPSRVSSNRLHQHNTLNGLMPTNQGVIEQNTFFNKIGHVVKLGWKLLGYAKAPYARGDNQLCLVFAKLVKADPDSHNHLDNLEAGIYWNHASPNSLFFDDRNPPPS